MYNNTKNDNDRGCQRFHCDNAVDAKFSLIDPLHESETGFCICSDLSKSGAHFFTDLEFQPGQKLVLSVLLDDSKHHSYAVRVVRADSSLYDEERFCAAVQFDQPLDIYQKLIKKKSLNSGSIAA